MLASRAMAYEVPSRGGKHFHNAASSMKLVASQEQAIEDRLAAVEKDYNGLQMAVLVIDSLQGEPIDSLSLRVAKKWKIGQKRSEDSEGDNGVLLVLAMKERQYRFELGRQLDKLLSESLADAVARHVMIQDFWAGEYGSGIERTIEAVNFAAHGEYPQSVALYEQDDERGLWERLCDLVRCQTLSPPTAYDYFYQGREKADPAWGGGNHKKEVRGLWIISIMIVISALFGIYDFRLGGVVGLIEGAAFSWFCCSMPLPVLS